MGLVKQSSGMLKEFVVGDKPYSFYYMADPDEQNNASVYTFTDEEGVRVSFWYPNINKEDVVLDIGASFGSYTLAALALGATVYAFSPEHEYPKLMRSVKENRGFRQRAHLYNFGFYSAEGLFKTDTARFSEVGQVPIGEIETWYKNHLCGWYIPVRTLDSFIPNLHLEKIDFIKLDTEGAEYEILKGGVETLKKYKPKLLVEIHKFKDDRVGYDIEGNCHQLLKEIGYEGRSHQYHANNIAHGYYIWPTSKS